MMKLGEMSRATMKKSAASLKKTALITSSGFVMGRRRDFLVSTEIEVDKTKERRELLKTRAESVLAAIEPLETTLTEREYQPLLHLLAGTDSKKEIAGIQGDELRQKLENLEERVRTLKGKYPAEPVLGTPCTSIWDTCAKR